MDSHALLVAVADEPSSRTREHLELESVLDTESGLWLSTGHLPTILPKLRSALMQRQVRSAALLPRVPEPDMWWLALEWWGALVVATDLLDQLGDDARHWTAGHCSVDLGITVLEPRESDDWQEEPRREEGVEAQVVKTATEYRAALRAAEPVITRCRVMEAIEDSASWFGELSEPTVGGVMALLTLSGATSMESQIVLRNPAALGLEWSQGERSLAHHRKLGDIEVTAVGLSRGHPLPDFLGTSLDDDSHRVAEERESGFKVALRLSPRVDPEIVIDRGIVFEQTGINRVQTLATSQPRTVNVDRVVPVVLPAWCLNESLSPPGGEPIRPTPLRYVGQGPQRAVWDDVAGRLATTGG